MADKGAEEQPSEEPDLHSIFPLSLDAELHFSRSAALASADADPVLAYANEVFFRTLAFPDSKLEDWLWNIPKRHRDQDLAFTRHMENSRIGRACLEELRKRSNWFIREAPWFLPNNPYRWSGHIGKMYKLYQGDEEEREFIRKQMKEGLEHHSFTWKVVRDPLGRVPSMPITVQDQKRTFKDQWTREFNKTNESPLHAHLEQTINLAGARPYMLTINPRVALREGDSLDPVEEWLSVPKDLYRIVRALESLDGCIRAGIVVEGHPFQEQGLGKSKKRKPLRGEEGGAPNPGASAEWNDAIEEHATVNPEAVAIPAAGGYIRRKVSEKKRAAKAAARMRAQRGIDAERLNDPDPAGFDRDPERFKIINLQNDRLRREIAILKELMNSDPAKKKKAAEALAAIERAASKPPAPAPQRAKKKAAAVAAPPASPKHQARTKKRARPGDMSQLSQLDGAAEESSSEEESGEKDPTSGDDIDPEEEPSQDSKSQISAGLYPSDEAGQLESDQGDTTMHNALDNIRALEDREEEAAEDEEMLAWIKERHGSKKPRPPRKDSPAATLDEDDVVLADKPVAPIVTPTTTAPPPPPPPPPDTGPAKPPAEPLPTHTLAGLPHYHITLWLTNVVGTEHAEVNQIQRLLEQYFDDMKISPPRRNHLANSMGAERYWLIASDCNTCGDFLHIVNHQNAGLPSEFKFKHPNPARQFRQSFEHLFEKRVRHIHGWLRVYENYLWSLKTVSEGRAGFPSLSDRYDSAERGEQHVNLGTPLHDKTQFNIKFNGLLVEKNWRLWDKNGKWCLMEPVSPLHQHSYKILCEGINKIRAHLCSFSDVGWQDQVVRHSQSWDKDFSFIAEGICRDRLLRLDYRWVELTNAYYFIVADPNADPSEMRKDYLSRSVTDEKALHDTIRRTPRNMPVWWPLPGSIIYRDDDGAPTLRTYVNGFLYKGTHYIDVISKKWTPIEELVVASLGGAACGFHDTRLWQHPYDKSLPFDRPWDVENDSLYSPLPERWLQVIGPYSHNPCEGHYWIQLSEPADGSIYQCSKMGCGLKLKGRLNSKVAFENGKKVKVPVYERPTQTKLESWGPATWERCMTMLRNCIISAPEDYIPKQRSLVLMGEGDKGKSSVTGPFGSEGKIFRHEEVMVVGDGTPADRLAGLGNHVRIFHGAEFDPYTSFPVKDGKAVAKKFLEGGRIPARGMKTNSENRTCNFPKLFDCNPKYFKRQTNGEWEDKLARGWNGDADAGNPFGPDYDPTNAFEKRLEVLVMRIPLENIDRSVVDHIKQEESMDVAFYLWELHFVPPERRHLWRRPTSDT